MFSIILLLGPFLQNIISSYLPSIILQQFLVGINAESCLGFRYRAAIKHPQVDMGGGSDPVLPDNIPIFQLQVMSIKAQKQGCMT